MSKERGEDKKGKNEEPGRVEYEFQIGDDKLKITHIQKPDVEAQRNRKTEFPKKIQLERKKRIVPGGAIDLMMPLIAQTGRETGGSGQAEWVYEFEIAAPLNEGEGYDEGFVRACRMFRANGWSPMEVVKLMLSRLESFRGKFSESYDVVSNREKLLSKVREIYSTL